MSRSPVLTTLVATGLAGFFLVAVVLLGSGIAAAQTAIDVGGPQPGPTDTRATLDAGDELAALEAVQLALTEVGDGNTFVWYRANGKLSGVFQPTSSFKDVTGKICRHLKMMLTSGTTSRKAEGIACREASGLWSLEG